MAFRGPTFYLDNTAGTDTPPAATVCVCVDTFAHGLSSATTTGTAGSAVIKQVWATAGGGLSTATTANTTQANNKGWWFGPTTEMGGSPTALRVIPAGSTITIKGSITCTGLSGNNTVTTTIYRRSAAGAYTQIGTGNQAAANGVAGTVTGIVLGVTIASEQTFTTGETLYIELYVTIASQTVTAGTFALGLQSTHGALLNSPNGLLYRYFTSVSASATASAAKGLVTLGILRSSAVAASAAKSVVISVFKSAASTATAVVSKRVTTVPWQAFIAAAEADVFKIVLVPKPATITASAAMQRTTGAFRAATLVTSASYTKTISKNIAASVTLIPVLAKFLNLARSASASVTTSSFAVIGLTQTVLNRISSGGSTIIKRISYIFDD